MPRKFVFTLIAAGFGISMELVLALHLMLGIGNKGFPVSIRSANQTLVSTIDISQAQKNQPAQPLAPNQETQTQGAVPGDITATPEAYHAPDAGYPAVTEPADSASPTEAATDEGPGQPPDTNNNQPEGGYPPPGNSSDNGSNNQPQGGYPPPDDNGDYGHGNYPTEEPPIPEVPTEAPVPTDVPPTPAPPTSVPPTSEPPATEPAPAPVPTATPAATAPAATGTPESPAPVAPTNTASAPTSSPTGLISIPASTAPKLDGIGSDPAWDAAPVTVIDIAGGANHSAARVSLRSVYNGKNIYFLVTWADPGQSFLLNPWEKQKDGSWKVLISPENKGGDENQFFMDKLALLWPINNSLPDFATRGCAGACHSGEAAQAKAYGLMYTGGAGQIGDLWHWKSVENVGQMDDQYLDNTQYSKNTPWAGFKSDPGNGGYHSNQAKNGKAPAYMPPGGGDKTGAPGFILDSEKAALDTKLFKPGDRVPGMIVAPFQGDRGDIHAGWKYNQGAWTLEISRRLVTGSPYDVQFDDLSKSYAFALAGFDDTQVRHAVQSGAAVLRFKK